jgi:hypothetical protein
VIYDPEQGETVDELHMADAVAGRTELSELRGGGDRMSHCTAIEVGKTYRIHYGAGNINNKTVHVLAIVEGKYVVKWWSRGKRAWMYDVESPYYFAGLMRDGYLRPR